MSAPSTKGGLTNSKALKFVRPQQQDVENWISRPGSVKHSK